MAVLSKPLSIDVSCYELGHCWTPYCTKASTDIAANVFKESLKIYGTLYLVAGLLRKRRLDYYVKKFMPETLRSSLFLTINGTLFISMFCIWRNMLGCLFFLTSGFIPAYIAAFIAVLCERKSRRGPLAVYLTNLAIETGFRMLVERKIVTPVRHGEVYLFSAVSAIYLYLFRKKDGLSPDTHSLFKFFVGGEEGPQRGLSTSSSGKTVRAGSRSSDKRVLAGQSGSKSVSGPDEAADSGSKPTADPTRMSEARQWQGDGVWMHKPAQDSSPGSVSRASLSSSSSSFLSTEVKKLLSKAPFIDRLVGNVQGQLRAVLRLIEGLHQHKSCPHAHSCISYVLKGGAKMFTLGYTVQAVISTLSVLTSILKKPSVLKNTLFSKLNLKLAMFLGGYSAVFRAVNCLLRWIRGKDSESHGLIAGALAGLCLRFYRSVTIALYTATKLMEILYFKGVQFYGLPYIKSADIFIYAFSTAFILHAAVVEPHTLRPGYWKFLLRITGNRFAHMNRQLLDVFGVNSSKIKPDYWPDYDPRFTTLARSKS